MTLKKLVIINVSAVIVVIMALMGFITETFVRDSQKEILHQDLFTLISGFAADIDDKLLNSQHILGAGAKVLTKSVVSDSRSAQQFLDNRVGTKAYFSKGIFIFNPDGALVAESPRQPGPPVNLVPALPFIRKAATGLHPTVSDPFELYPGQGYVVMISVPIADRTGSAVAVYAGCLGLLDQGLLGKYLQTRIGKTGYLYLYDQRRTMIMHPDKTRIMKRDVPVGANRFFDQALDGFEGTGETINSRGLKTMASFKRLTAKEWILAANFPAKEAYAPLSKLKLILIVTTVGGIVCACLVIILLTGRLTRNLDIFTNHLRDFFDKKHEEQLLQIPKGDEVHVLAQTFNDLVRELDRRSEAVRASEAQIKVDVSDLKRMNLLLEEAREAAEAANRAKSDFLAIMSHEIRTPLNGIIGMTELALDTDLSGEQREYLRAVKISTDNLFLILNDILDFSKIEAGRIDMEQIPFMLRDNLGKTLTSVSARATEKGLELGYDIMPDVPDILRGDPGRLRQVLLNLVGNAIKFTNSGEISVSVKLVEIRDNEVELAFCVADSGIGISLEAQERIFNPFIQADGSTTRHYGGTGLGLAISRRLVELMGGSIHVTSRPGDGSRFCFTVRFLRESEDLMVLVPEHNLSDKRVLIVDDIAINRDLLGHLLGKWGLKGDAVYSAEEALLQLRRTEERGIRYDLILLDVHMPEISGWSLASGIRDNPVWDDCRIIMMPSVGEKGDSQRCRELRLDGYLMKPVIPDELEEMIRAVLGRPKAPEAPATASAPHLRQESLRILVAEDVEINQKLARRILEKLGHRVTLAANGREAVSCWESGDFDLILMDIQMPEMDGYEAAGTIRAKEKATGRHIPIAAMTAFALKGDDDKCLAAGMDGYISKPVKAEEIRLTIEQLIRNGKQ